MSHFSVSVITNSQDQTELEKILQPFHEYECTGVNDEYVVFVDHHDEVMKEWNEKTDDYWSKDGNIFKTYDDLFYREFTAAEIEKHGPINFMGTGCGNGLSWTSRDWGDGQGYRTKVRMSDEEVITAGYEKVTLPVSDGFEYDSPEQYAKDYHGYGEVKNGRVGRMTNPNAQWDWWSVGGRWSDQLLLNDGSRANSARKDQIDFLGMTVEAERKAASEHIEAQNIIAGRQWLTWSQAKEQAPTIDDARTLYNDQIVVKDFRNNQDAYRDLDEFHVTKEEYVERARWNAISSFAFLDQNGWQERGAMGWWGCVGDEKDGWGKTCTDLLISVPDDQYITIVDCHI